MGMRMEQDRGDVLDGLEARGGVLPLSRRRLLLRGLGLVAAVVGGEAFLGRRGVEVSRHRVVVTGLKRSLRLVQISDLHRSRIVSEAYLKRVVGTAQRESPDVVLLTGDFVSSSSAYMASLAECLVGLKPGLGMLGVLGNHDYRCDGDRGVGRVLEVLSGLGVEVLVNRSVVVGDVLRVVGVDDYACGFPDVGLAFSGVGAGLPVVAMTHNPAVFPWMARYDCVTLAGHTHGGQVYVPMVTGALFPSMARYLRGWYGSSEGPGRLYVSRGVGVVGVPLRIGSNPEIGVFDLVPG